MKTRIPFAFFAAATLLGLAYAAPSSDDPTLPGTPFLLCDIRGQGSAEGTLDRLGIPESFNFHPEEAVVRDFLRDRDIACSAIVFGVRRPKPVSFFPSLSVADRKAFSGLLAANSWSREPPTPEGFKVVAPPVRKFRYYITASGGNAVVSEDPAALRAALTLFPGGPGGLPVEGDIAVQIPTEIIKQPSAKTTAFGGFLEQCLVDRLAVGIGIDDGTGPDGGTAFLHALFSPRPGARLAEGLRASGPIPPSAACVNLPGSVAFLAKAPGGAKASPASPAAQPFSLAVFPSSRPDAPPSVLAYLGLDDPPAARETLLAACPPSLAVTPAAPHRGIAVDTFSVTDPGALSSLLSARIGSFPASGIFGEGLASGELPLSLAWLPDGLLLAFNDPGSALLPAAIDAALDGTAVPFENTAAFRDAFPVPDGPAFAIVHLDLPALLPLLPSEVTAFLPSIPPPCPVDLFACNAPDGSLVLRLRAPAALPPAIIGMATKRGKPSSSPAPDPGPKRQVRLSDIETRTPFPPTSYLGYPEAYVMHNERVHAVVVPAISRLAFLAESPDAPNFLRLDPDLAAAGATPPDASTAPDFFNIGGDWAWPVLQSRWPSFSPAASDWPPPPALADAPSTAEAWTTSDGSQHVLLTRHYPAPVHATLAREFILDADEAPILQCRQTLERDPDAPADALPLSIWHLSQVANPEGIIFEVSSPEFEPDVLSGTLDPDACSVEIDDGHCLFAYAPPPGSETKFSLPGRDVAAKCPGHDLFINASEPARVEVYSNPGLGYAELESATPESQSVTSALIYYLSAP